jgi:hypothetical protein
VALQEILGGSSQLLVTLLAPRTILHVGFHGAGFRGLELFGVPPIETQV